MRNVKTISFALLIGLSVTSSIAQPTQFKSKWTNTHRSTREKAVIERDIIITKETITISKIWNGGTEDAKLRIEKIVKKGFNSEPSSWYYCVDTNESMSTEDSSKKVYRKVIMILPETMEDSPPNGIINLYTFIDEVQVDHYSFAIF